MNRNDPPQTLDDLELPEQLGFLASHILRFSWMSLVAIAVIYLALSTAFPGAEGAILTAAVIFGALPALAVTMWMVFMALGALLFAVAMLLTLIGGGYK